MSIGPFQIDRECSHDWDRAIRKGRCHYVCPDCGQDISFEVMLLAEALYGEQIEAGIRDRETDLKERPADRMERQATLSQAGGCEEDSE